MKQIDIRGYIGTGKDSAVTREELCRRTSLSDREIRTAIQAARKDTVIINLGKGYFIPDETETELLSKYVNMERRKAVSTLAGLKFYEALLADRKADRL